MVMPAVGFDVVPSDCLALHVARRSRRPRRLFLGIAMPPPFSRGSVRTMVEQIGRPPLVRRRGVIQDAPPASLERSFDYGQGPSPSVAVSSGGRRVRVLQHGCTGHHRLLRGHGGGTDARYADPPVRLGRALDALASVAERGCRLVAGRPLGARTDAPPEAIVAEIEGDGDDVHRSRLQTPDSYSFTAVAAVAIAARVLAGDFEPETPRLPPVSMVRTSSSPCPGVVREDL